MTVYHSLCAILSNRPITELGLLPFIPQVDDLPNDTRSFHPLMLIDSNLGVPFPCLEELLRDAHNHFHSLSSNDPELDIVTRIMLLLKPDNYTAMNTRKRLLEKESILPDKEIQLLDLMFTVPKHTKSAIAWHHRQWVHNRTHKQYLNLDHELALCDMSATRYPRNYFAWNHRHWLLETVMQNDIEAEYDRMCSWAEKNVSDYSGLHHLERVMDIHPALDWQSHRLWLDDMILRYPGHASLWQHRRFCALRSDSVAPYYDLVERVIKADDRHQKELALSFVLWLGVFGCNVGRETSKEEAYARQLKELEPIPCIYTIPRKPIA
ncbi:hypothetical protein BCR43DRAFT_492726 [Syncephalastrum racemosum]|uniref:Protein prenylyltransferase n=1 Tax=Syncephalastrum racemosum TaxID=13706 RepID=A0A1X2HAP9_SYNRA|nr:hypothetical protein BCR43DRAFT_492726 [Syncephalastrum racemosum]